MFLEWVSESVNNTILAAPDLDRGGYISRRTQLFPLTVRPLRNTPNMVFFVELALKCINTPLTIFRECREHIHLTAGSDSKRPSLLSHPSHIPPHIPTSDHFEHGFFVGNHFDMYQHHLNYSQTVQNSHGFEHRSQFGALRCHTKTVTKAQTFTSRTPRNVPN